MNSQMSFAQAPTTQKVLITGFYDWRDLGTPPEQTRCRGYQCPWPCKKSCQCRPERPLAVFEAC